MKRLLRGAGPLVSLVLLIVLVALPAGAGNAPIAQGAVETDNGVVASFVVFAEDSPQTGVVNFTNKALHLTAGFELSSCVYQDGNRLWAVGPVTHLHGDFELGDYALLYIEDNEGTAEPDRRGIYPGDGFPVEEFCSDPEFYMSEFEIGFDVVRGDITIRQ